MAILRNRQSKNKISFYLLFLGLLYPACAYSASLDQIKMAFIYNFSHYVTWPESSFQSAESPFTICLDAEQNLLTLMELTVKDENINGRSFSVVGVSDFNTEQNCQIHYINTSRFKKIPSFLINSPSPTLFVSDYEDFAEQGGMIGIKKQGKQLKLIINLKVVKKAGLVIRSNLLNLATIID